MTFVKVRFTSKTNGSTAGLILTLDKFKKMSITDISRMFPYSESVKMAWLEVSNQYSTWDMAFAHDFGNHGGWIANGHAYSALSDFESALAAVVTGESQ